MKLPTENIAGFEPDPNASTAPIKQGQTTAYVSTQENQRLILPAEVLIIVLVLDVQMLIMTDVLLK
jgi:hypothetical protein